MNFRWISPPKRSRSLLWEIFCLRFHGWTNRGIAQKFGIPQDEVERIWLEARSQAIAAQGKIDV
ncbi:MAG: hypothetical protein B7733_15165 [Myxococcales bacterium FL481]|nr:MAG: hypothetical protein B7733_15165 [Myxococcales bacterium FL481]